MDIKALVAAACAAGWENVFAVFTKAVRDVAAEQQPAFTDLYFHECLNFVDGPTEESALWMIAVQWHMWRKLSLSGYNLSPAEAALDHRFLTQLRAKLWQRLEHKPVIPVLPPDTARSLIGLWCGAFFSSFSVLNQIDEPKDYGIGKVISPAQESSSDTFSWLLRMSMEYPYDADRFSIDVGAMFAANIPSYAKVILAMWLVNIPRYNATGFHRQKLLTNFQVIDRATRKVPSWMDPHFHLLAEWLMTALFRMAYLSEENSQTAALFGGFISSQMKRFFPQFSVFFPKTGLIDHTARKIRIGYVSNRFVANAVTFYMANRIFHHDRNTFEVYVFALGAQNDTMTELLARNSEKFIRLENSLDYRHNAQVIRDSDLDILLFADIGMGIPTYLLAGLRLAPVQGALLGHAAPTGLPTIDYFFSSEIEPAHAQLHYREQLIRMPNVGASQIMPPGLGTPLTRAISRQKLGISEQAFVFVSCANGMKHIPERDYIWVEILRKIPQAWILIKPFSPGDYDRKLVERIKKAGEAAGAPDRIRYIEGFHGHNEIFALLALADVQLDTYPFNGWTTTIEAICLALPTVTQEGQAYRSRLGAGFLRAMGIEEGIAATEDEYVAWAVKFANDSALCRWVKNRIKATRKQLLFDNMALQMEYEKTLIGIVRRKSRQEAEAARA